MVTIHRVPRKHIYRVWPLLYRGLSRCLKYLPGYTHEMVLQELQDAEGEELYVVMLDAKKFRGFFTLKVIEFVAETWGIIGFFHLADHKSLISNEEVLREGMPLLEGFLKKRGCTHFNFIARRRAFERFGRKLGFQPRLVEWVKEV